MPYPGLLHPEPLQQSTADPYLQRRHSNRVLSQSLWGLWVLICTRFVGALWASLSGMGFYSKHNLAPPTVLLGLLLCPWTWVISSNSLQHCTAATAAPTILQGLLCPWIGKYSEYVYTYMVSLAAVDSFKTHTIMGVGGLNLTEEAQSILSKAYE